MLSQLKSQKTYSSNNITCICIIVFAAEIKVVLHNYNNGYNGVNGSCYQTLGMYLVSKHIINRYFEHNPLIAKSFKNC